MNFGIKSFLSQNCGACVYTKIWKEERGNSKLPRLCQSRNQLHKDRYQLIQMRTGIGSLRMTSTDNDNELRLASGNTCRTLQKEKD